MINDRSLRKMKKGAWLINSSRGEVADTASIKKALRSGRLAGAVIDVWEHEPDLDRELMQESFIATPHIAGYSADGKANGTASVVNLISEYFNLPPKKWYPLYLPPPGDPVIEIAAGDNTGEEVVRLAVGHTYNIAEDDLRLRFSPSDFEIQRGNYPLRREFPAYTVRLSGGNGEISKTLKKLGFRVR
jgi:erythronate-4-phosphate dehydrogenase